MTRHCVHCDAPVSAQARFCEQCGQPLEQQPAETPPTAARDATIKVRLHQVGEWFRVGTYMLCVHTVHDGEVHPTSPGGAIGLSLARLLPQSVRERSLCIEVEYRNELRNALKFRPGQWQLFDMHGYNYECGYAYYLFHGQHTRRLSAGWLNAQRRVRGWVAFLVPGDMQPDYVQFLPSHGQPHSAMVTLRQP